MKKVYIGFAMAFLFIAGGVLISIFYKPTLNMAAMGDYYYSSDRRMGKYMSTDTSISKKLISGDEDTLKIRFDIKNFNGNIDIEHSFYFEDETLSKEEKEILKRYKKNKEETLTSLEVNYKWIDKPKNLAVVKESHSSIKEYGIVSKRKPILNNGEVALNYIGSLRKNVQDGVGNINEEGLYMYGENGTGTLEIEFKSIYK